MVDILSELGNCGFVQVLNPGIGVDACRRKNFFRSCKTDTVDIGQAEPRFKANLFGMNARNAVSGIVLKAKYAHTAP